jgi:hypothetical protein
MLRFSEADVQLLRKKKRIVLVEIRLPEEIIYLVKKLSDNA